ncbi:hypothetical protein SAMN05518672_101306 [Chitinophaga sp. CF118]|uniref:hypothetical protein n=1 Tax=Chitinophaga sp. CF118 TaxID=1884367 RepID=UPI0008E05369|nr:hypothetical protein [Chitinophaga sp. CF118]SFD06746.1 hypothetical protein SAMN05518672_101306 [Chitinophaga sp. CF118]
MKAQLNLYAVQLLILLLFTSTLTRAQLKLGDNPGAIQKSALLELDSKTQGLLLPRISDLTLPTLQNSPDGMIIYYIPNQSLYIRANNTWQNLAAAGGSGITSLNGLNASVQLFKTTNLTAGGYAITSTGGTHTLNIPNASATVNGFMSTGSQIFSGSKIFNGALFANGSFVLGNGMTSTTGQIMISTSATQPIQLISGDVNIIYGTSVSIGSATGTTITQDLFLPQIGVDDTKDTVLLIDQGKVWKKKLSSLSGGAASTLPIRVVTTGTTVGDDDYTVVRSGTADGPVTITLPSATGRTGRVFVIKRATGAADVAVSSNGSSFDGDDSNTGFNLTDGGSATLQSDGTYWFIISISSPI